MTVCSTCGLIVADNIPVSFRTESECRCRKEVDYRDKLLNLNKKGYMQMAGTSSIKFDGLQGGRIVNFVTKSGNIRPMLIVLAFLSSFPDLENPSNSTLKPNGTVNGIVFRDPVADMADFSQCEGDTHARLAEFAQSVPFADGPGNPTPGTWHWPAKGVSAQPVIPQAMLDRIMDEHDAKIQAFIKTSLEAAKDDATEACSDLLVSESFEMSVNQIVSKALDGVFRLRVEALKAVIGAQPARNDNGTSLEDLSNQINDINVKLVHHGIVGPAQEVIEDAEGFNNQGENGPVAAARSTDVFSQPSGQAPQGAGIGAASVGHNDGAANAAALDKAQNK